jgi:hypothetical protein
MPPSGGTLSKSGRPTRIWAKLSHVNMTKLINFDSDRIYILDIYRKPIKTLLAFSKMKVRAWDAY